jgi:hypothetical protein
VPTELAPVLVDDRPHLGGEAAARKEVAVVATGEEADLLALRPPRGGEPRALRLGARRLLRLLAEREPEPVEVPRVEPREHVGLVLARVFAARK